MNKISYFVAFHWLEFKSIIYNYLFSIFHSTSIQTSTKRFYTDKIFSALPLPAKMWAHILRRGRRCIWLSTFIREIASQNINSAPDIHGSFSQHWNFTNKILGWYHIGHISNVLHWHILGREIWFWKYSLHFCFNLMMMFLFEFQNQRQCHYCQLWGRNLKDVSQKIGFPATARALKWTENSCFEDRVSTSSREFYNIFARRNLYWKLCTLIYVSSSKLTT